MGDDCAVKKVLLKAPMLTQSGYGVHSRQIARYLIAKAEAGVIDLYLEPVRWGDTTWALDAGMFDGLVGKMKRYFKPLIDSSKKRLRFDVSIQVILPNEWTPADAEFNIGVTAGVETDRCSQKWVECCNAMDVVIVPSSFTESVFRASGNVTTPIHVVPESYIDALDKPRTDVDFGIETGFNFLIVGQLTANHSGLDRKNVYGTLKDICDVFRNDPDVGIIVKTNSGRGSKIDRLATVDKFKQMVASARKGDFPRIRLIHGDMSDSEMAALYTHPSVKALVSLTRGEGYGLPILEAAVAGVPVIATDWSGHLDFMSKGRFIRVGYELGLIPDQKIDGNIWIKGARWANPSDANAVAALKKFRQSPEIPKQWALELSSRLRSEYSYDAIARIYDDVIGGRLT